MHYINFGLASLLILGVHAQDPSQPPWMVTLYDAGCMGDPQATYSGNGAHDGEGLPLTTSQSIMINMDAGLVSPDFY
jgi:hypothetical protein